MRILSVLFFLFCASIMLAQPVHTSVDICGSGTTYSINAHELWQGGGLGLSLSGQGLRVYMWEASNGSGSHPDTNNAQLAGRISIGNSFDGVSSHATEMAKIMVGQTGDSTEGIAYNANLISYQVGNFNADIIQALASGMELSNHSYGTNWGWNNAGGSLFWWGLEEIDSTEDYNFGRYNYEAAFWDSLHHENPFFLAVKSSGNTRGETHSGSHSFYRSVGGSTSNYNVTNSTANRDADGGASGLDCLPSDVTAKNLLVVGAVNPLLNGWQYTSDVVLRNNSNTGPTDDGRIKPDVVAGGNNTSQASAAVAGSLILLKEHFEDIYNRKPLGSTLRALLCHTADEAGENPGPDYRFGWGLVNAKRAAEHISNTNALQHIYEDTLHNGDTIRFYFSGDSSALRFTLAWTDPEGTPVPFANSPSLLDNPSAMLINDLDLKVYQLTDSSSFYPFTLDVQNPTFAASKGVNSTDNVERVQIIQAGKTWYVAEVSHKGSLQTNQAFSLLSTGARSLLYYNGSEWVTKSPSSQSAEADMYIAPNSILTLSPGFQVHHFFIGANAHVKVQ